MRRFGYPSIPASKAYGPHMGYYMGPIWALCVPISFLQTGSIWVPYGQSHMGPIWVPYGLYEGPIWGAYMGPIYFIITFM